jgi:hypothetical protein
MDANQCAIIGPQIEIVVDRAFRRQVFRNRTLLATGREHIHETVHDLLCEKQVFGSEHQREGHPKAAETFFRARSRARDKSSSQI